MSDYQELKSLPWFVDNPDKPPVLGSDEVVHSSYPLFDEAHAKRVQEIVEDDEGFDRVGAHNDPDDIAKNFPQQDSLGRFIEGDEQGHEFRVDPPQPSEMEEALAIAGGVRSEIYGPPREHWTNTGRGWAGLIAMRLGIEVPDLPPDLVALMFDYDKSIRLCKTPTHRDSRVDKHGYINLHGDVT